jgi:putative Holliday junction resolvase
MRFGRRLGIDAGTVRVGLAISDPHGILASPLSNLKRLGNDQETAEALASIVAEYELLEIYVGLPLSLRATNTASTMDAVGLARAIELKLDVPVRLIDERMTSVSANSILKNAGRGNRQARKVVDQVAATLILEQALSIEKTGVLPGMSLTDFEKD